MLRSRPTAFACIVLFGRSQRRDARTKHTKTCGVPSWRYWQRSTPKQAHNKPASWPRARLLDPLALALVGDRAPTKGAEKAAYLLSGLASYRLDIGAYAQARSLYERALAIHETALGPDHPDTGGSLNNLAHLLQAQGNFSGARPLFERALAIRETALGPEHPGTATSLNNLAGLLQAQGDRARARDFAGARSLYEHALAITRRLK